MRAALYDAGRLAMKGIPNCWMDLWDVVKIEAEDKTGFSRLTFIPLFYGR
jgi:hypothetical protein